MGHSSFRKHLRFLAPAITLKQKTVEWWHEQESRMEQRKTEWWRRACTGTGYKEKLAAEQPFKAEVIDLSNPINQVKRMSRENWVERPTRPVRGQQPNK